jgi:hypothetical protein
MRKYAAATALVIALNITMLTPAVSNGRTGPLHEEECDGWRPDWGRTYAIRCHRRFECGRQCTRQYSYTVTLPCSGWGYRPGFVTKLPNGLCDVRVLPEAYHACISTCVNAVEATRR